MGKISQARIREAAEDLVQWRYGVGTAPTASDAGTDMRDWQLSGNRVTAAARNAVEKTKRRPTTRKVNNIQAQISASSKERSQVLNKKGSSEKDREDEYLRLRNEVQRVDKERVEVIQEIKKASGSEERMQYLKNRRKELGFLSLQLEHKVQKESRRRMRLDDADS